MAVLNKILPKNITEYPNSFERQGSFPLERWSVFYSIDADENGEGAKTALEAAQDYASNSAISYVGQILSVVSGSGDSVSVDVYKIADEAGNLVALPDEEALSIADGSIAELSRRMQSVEDILNGTEAVGTEGDENYQPATNGLVKDVEDLADAVEKAQGDATKALEDASKAQKDASDALAFESRISVLESKEHVTSEQIATAKSEAIASAKTETENQISAVVSQYLTGDGAADTIDTLNEIAQWIADDEAGAAKIIKDVKAIQDDYLTSADATTINGTITSLDNRLSKEIDDLEAFVGTIPEGATSETVIAYIQEVVDALKIGDYAKAQDLIDLAARVTALDKEGGRIALIESGVNANTAEINTIKGAIGAIPSGNNIAAMLNNKVDKVEGSRLINETEIAILSKLNLNDGQVEIGGTVAAGSVTNLPQRIADILNSTEASGVGNEGTLLNGKIQGRHLASAIIAESHLSADLVSKLTNSVKQIKIGDADAVDAGGSLTFSDEFKFEKGAVALNTVNVNKLTQTEGEWLILDGGDSSSVYVNN